MIRFNRLFSVAATLALLSFGWGIPSCLASIYDEARSAELRGDYDTAIDSYKRSMAQEQRNTRALEGLYRVYKKLRRYDEAEQICNELERATGDESTRLDLGDLLRSAGRHYEAQRVYNEYLAKHPTDCYALMGLGECLQATGNYTAARETFIRAGESGPECYQAARRHLAKIGAAQQTSMTDIDQEIGRWPSNMMPLKVYIEDGSNSQGYRSDMKQHVYSALDEWNNAAARLVQMEIVNDPEKANIVVDWAPKIPTALGVARPEWKGDVRTLHRVRITLATNVDSHGKTLPPESPATSSLYDARNRMMKEVTLHEFGHALGLEHSPRPDDIMSAGVFGLNSDDVPSARSLQRGDIDRLTQLYSAPYVAPQSVAHNSGGSLTNGHEGTESGGGQRAVSGAGATRVKPTIDPRTAQDMQEALFNMNSGNFDVCAEQLSRIVARRPSDAQAHYLLAVTYVNLRKYELAAKHYSEVMKLVPQGKLNELASSGLSKIKH